MRKRDGSVSAFDPDKLASSIYAARRQIEDTNAAFHASELAQAVLHFLAQEYAGTTPTTEEIADTVCKVLHNMGQEATARSFVTFRQRRVALRERIHVFEETVDPSEANLFQRRAVGGIQEPSELWNKQLLLRSLQAEGELDEAGARLIAAAVERKLLLLGEERVSAGLLRELVDNELRAHGMRRAWNRWRLLGIPARSVEQYLKQRPDADQLSRWAGREVLARYALQEVFSPDVAGLHDDGMLHLYDAAAPGHWACAAVDTLTLASRCNHADQLADALAAELDRLARYVDGALAIEGWDGILALRVQSPQDDPSAWAERLVSILRQATHGGRARVVLNLHARIAAPVLQGLSDGPLFDIQPTASQEEFARDFAHACAQRVLAERELQDRVRVDLHLEANKVEPRAQWLPWLRWAKRHPNLVFRFDRGEVQLAEGLFWDERGRSAVYQYVGLNLLALPKPRGSAESVFQRVGLLCESALRAGVQKREFLRRQHTTFFSPRDHDRSVFVLVPIGLDGLVADTVGEPLGENPDALAFAEQLLGRLVQRARREGRKSQLRCVVDGLPDLMLALEPRPRAGQPAALVLGNTPALVENPRAQIAAGAVLHAAAGAGTTICRLPAHTDPEEMLELLHHALVSTTTTALRFAFPVSTRQATFVEEWLP